VTLVVPDAADRKALSSHRPDIEHLARTNQLELVERLAERPRMPWSGVGASRGRCAPIGARGFCRRSGTPQESHQKAQDEHDRLQKKLGNEAFVAKAPAAVVEKDKARVAELSGMLANLNDSLQRIEQGAASAR